MKKSNVTPFTVKQVYTYKDNPTPFVKEDVYHNGGTIVYTQRGKRVVNDCFHTTLQWNMRRYSVILQKRGDASNWILKASNHGYYNPPFVRIADNIPPLGFLGRAWESAQPKMNSEANLPVFLKELTDIRSVFDSARKSIMLSIKRKSDTIESLRQKRIRAAAGLKLNYEYAIKTTLSDIFSIGKSYSDFIDAVNNLNLRSGKKLVHSYSEQESVPEMRSQEDNGYETFHYHWPAFVRKWNVTIMYSYSLDLPYPPTLNNYFRYMGWDRWASSLWEIIPYSFCIDWVVQVGTWLESFDTNKMACGITIYDCCISQKYEYQFTGKTKSNGGEFAYFPENRDLGGYKLKVYNRQRIYPFELMNALNLPRIDNVSVRELVLASALLAAR